MSWRSEKLRLANTSIPLIPVTYDEEGFVIEEHPSKNLTLRGDGSHAQALAAHVRAGTHGTQGTRDGLLPAPATATSSSGQTKRKTARVEGNGTRNGWKGRWAQLVRRMGNGTAPTASSMHDVSTVGSSLAVNRVRGGRDIRDREEEDGPTFLDEIIVDRTWDEDLKLTVSDPNEPHEKTGSQRLGPGGTGTDRDSMVGWGGNNIWTSNIVLLALRYRLWPLVLEFFAARYVDEKTERQFEKEHWYYRKSLGLWSSVFLIVCWVLACAFAPQPFTIVDKYFYYVFVPLVTLPVTGMIMWDFPRDRDFIYQIWISVATWMWPMYQITTMYICGYYTVEKNWLLPCGSKDFLLLLFYLAALQSIGLFGLQLKRVSSLIGALAFCILTGVTIVPHRKTFVRQILLVAFYEGFLLYVHYMSEHSERRLYSLREQLKVQFRATQKAQVNERKASDSKRRLTSYVFHEVRVPLNTALLAVQNMEAEGAIPKGQELEFTALTGSLSMMSKVLNDVLDFNRMDSGRFESVAKPFAFHQVMKSLFVPLKLATDARKLDFEIELDSNIDLVARHSLYEASGLSSAAITTRLADAEDTEALVVGDETRLRQIITNLASNACKFTPAGGGLKISTKLLHPTSVPNGHASTTPIAPKDFHLPPSESGHTDDTHESAENTAQNPHHLSSVHLDQHNRETDHSHHDRDEYQCHTAIVRIEITDTGTGIRPRDMQECKLFSAFNQTEMGRQQGGKGTGLGLALVRQIVKLSGGRLGLISRTVENSGSTFWVELPFGVGAKTFKGLPSSQQTLLRTPSKRLRNPARPTTSDAEESSKSALMRKSSALHRIMDQAGMFELLPDGDQLMSGSMITRTLGDVSTGTAAPDAVPTSLDESVAATPKRPALQGREQSSETTVVGTPVREDMNIPMMSTSDTSASANTPASDPVSTTEKIKSKADPSPSSSSTRLDVLVVDDDPLTRTLMKRMLTRLGCSVTTAENGELGLELILGRPVDDPRPAIVPRPRFAAVFLDNQMPILTGVEAVARLRSEGRDDLVIGVTGNALLSDQEEYLAAGVDHVLTKPVLERNLRNMLALAGERMSSASAGSSGPYNAGPSHKTESHS